MSGSQSIRGYLVQAIILILEALQAGDWEAIALEPDHESEKVDIKWWHVDRIKVVQVKSSQNPFTEPMVRKWCRELRNATEANDYELMLVGACPPTVTRMSEVEGVRIPSPRNLDLKAMLAELAHHVSIYGERQDLPVLSGSSCDLIAHALVAKFEINSTTGKKVSRSELDVQVKKWILLTLKDRSPDTSVATNIASRLRPDEKPVSWMVPLQIQALGVDQPTAIEKPSALQSVLRGPNTKIALIGKSGTGKTSAMKMAAHVLTSETSNLAIWIPLKDYAANLVSTIKGSLGWYEESDDRILSILQRHNIILLLDGLDEVSENQRQLCIAEISQLMHVYRGSICVSYTATDHAYYGFECPAYEVLALTELQIRDIVDAYFTLANASYKTQQFFEKVNLWSETGRNDFNTLVQTPINLGFLLELALAEGFEYRSLKDLYGQVIEMRLKHTRRREKQGHTSPEVKVDCLTDLAFHSVVDGSGMRLSKAYVKEVFYARLGTAAEAAMALEDVIRNGLLMERNDLIVEWAHASFRDYLAGRRLFELSEQGKSLASFPLAQPHGIAATAHAIRLLTTHATALEKRQKIFRALLEMQPSIEAIHMAATEYHLLHDPIIGNAIPVELQKRRWVERFVESYRLIVNLARTAKLNGAGALREPSGLKIFLDANNQTCLMTFLDTKDIQFAYLENFEADVERITSQGQTCTGFCFYASLLFQLDPEIVAYILAGLWLKLSDTIGDRVRMTEWHYDLPALLVAQPDLVPLEQAKAPQLPPDLVAGPQQAYRQLVREYGQDRAREMLTICDLITRSDELVLPWHLIHAPVAFSIDPIAIQPHPKLASNRLSQLMLLTPPPAQISLLLLLPHTLDLDFNINIFIPFPVPMLNRYYSLYLMRGKISSGNAPMFVHLRG